MIEFNVLTKSTLINDLVTTVIVTDYSSNTLTLKLCDGFINAANAAITAIIYNLQHKTGPVTHLIPSHLLGSEASYHSQRFCELSGLTEATS